MKKHIQKIKEHVKTHAPKIKHHATKIFTLRNILVFILAVTIPFIIMLDNTKQAMLFETEELLEETGAFSRVEDLSQINYNVISFLVKRNAGLEGFTERETSHMKDVKWVVQNGYTFYITLIWIAFIAFFILITKYSLKDAAFALMMASIVSIIKLFLMGTINFGFLFTGIHKLLFEEGTWLFSQFDLLIRMYSFEFFEKISRRILINTAIQSIVLGFFGFMMKDLEKQE